MTDHKDRKTGFGFKNDKMIVFPWMQYTFPACKSCNEKYSILEGRIKIILKKLLSHKNLTQSDITDLLDWFDKVRIGIWLGQSLLHGEKLNPNFYINQRIGISDRLLVIYRSSEKEKGISFSGTESLAFKYSPSCFSLTINELTFISYSSAMLLSENMGFPYPDSIELYPNGQMKINKINLGKSKISRPLLKEKIIEPAVKIYQTILKSNVGEIINEPISNYITNNSIYYSKYQIISKPFIIDDFSEYFKFLEKEEKISFQINQGYPRYILMSHTAKIVLKHQNIEIERALKAFEHLPQNQKSIQIDFFKNIIALNNKLIETIEKELRPTT